MGGIAKGSGHDSAEYGTMLGFYHHRRCHHTADAPKSAVRGRTGELQHVSIDGDTSTNDMVTVLANGLAATPSSIPKARITLHSALRCMK
jgi:glutamate N-acetyltransferase/amino-acid N-acetyltransferase